MKPTLSILFNLACIYLWRVYWEQKDKSKGNLPLPDDIPNDIPWLKAAFFI
jgi:hypothetical protein